MKRETTENIVTDEGYLEQRAHGEAGFAFRYYEEDVFAFAAHRIDWHWHREFEFVFLARGEIACNAGGGEFALHAGEGLFVNSGVLHRYEAKGGGFLPNILFLPEFLGGEGGRVYEKYIAPVLHEGAECLVLRSEGETGEALKALLSVFEAQKTGNELDTMCALFALWKALYACLPRTRSRGERSLSAMRLRQMMAFIHENYARKISLEDIAASVYVSKNTALQIFREHIRLSPVAYLIGYRLERAAKLLTGGMPVSRIAEKCGFESGTYFSRKFKEMYGCSPSQYRARQEVRLELGIKLPRS